MGRAWKARACGTTCICTAWVCAYFRCPAAAFASACLPPLAARLLFNSPCLALPGVFWCTLLRVSSSPSWFSAAFAPWAFVCPVLPAFRDLGGEPLLRQPSFLSVLVLQRAFCSALIAVVLPAALSFSWKVPACPFLRLTVRVFEVWACSILLSSFAILFA